MQYYVARCHVGLCCFTANHILSHWVSSSSHHNVLFCRLCPLMYLVIPRDGWNQSLDPSSRDGLLRSSARLQSSPGTGPFSSWLFSVHPPMSFPVRATKSCFHGCLIQNIFERNLVQHNRLATSFDFAYHKSPNLSWSTATMSECRVAGFNLIY